MERNGPLGEPLQSRWNLRLGSTQARIRCGGLPLENIHGEVALTGGCDGRQFSSRGELALNSLAYKDCHFSDVLGPIWIDDGRMLFGSLVDEQDHGAAAGALSGPRRPPRPITANLFGGKVLGKGWIAPGYEPGYAVDATLIGADLARCAQDLGAGRQNLRGKISATAALSGSGRSRNTLSGGGNIHLTDADVYELPVMVSILSVLNLKLPSQRAFSAADVGYRIEGEHIYFDPIEFKGDAISLHGDGDMDFQSQIHLKLTPTVGPGELKVPLWDWFSRGAGQQLVAVHIDGPLQKPDVSKEVLPGVNQTLQQLRGEPPSRR